MILMIKIHPTLLCSGTELVSCILLLYCLAIVPVQVIIVIPGFDEFKM